MKHAPVDSVTHQVTFTAKPDSFGMFTVVITATDDSASSDTDTLAVNVTPINDSPFVYNPIPDTSFYVNSGTHVIVNNLYNVFKDIDTDLLVFSVDIVGDDISAEINGNSLSVTLEADSSGTNMVIVYTSDGELTVSDTFSVSFIRWAIQLTASLGNYFDRDNYLGVADGATNGLDTHFDEIEIPTLIDSNISLYFPHPEWNNQLGDNFSKDIRPEITLNDTLQIWDFEVVSTYAGEVTLTFVFKDFPDIPVMLKDSTTGIEQFLSNNAVYTFLALADSAYPFQVNVGDWTAPATISDLSVIETTSRSITIQWTAPGDDGNSGTAFEYDIRYLPSSISDDNFSSATRVTSGIPTPSLAGTADQLTIYGLNPFTTYYVAIKTMDDAGNVSSISNIDSVSTEGVPVLSPLAVWGKFHQDLQNSGNTAVDGAFLDSLLWRYQASDAINSSPTVDGSGSVYFGSEGGNVYALNADGSLKWSYNTGGGISAAPLVATLNRLYVGSKNGRFYAFNRETGEMEWTFLTGDQIVSSATVDGAGRIYVGSLDGKLYCLDSETGSLYWSVSIGTRIYSSPALSLDDSTVYIGGFDKKVYAVNTNTGQWRWFYTTGGYILGSAAVDTSGVIYIGSSDRKLYALNSDGSLKWSYTTGNSIWYSSPALGIDGNVYIGSDDKKLHAVRSSDGVLQWTYVTGGSIRNSPAVAGNGYVYVGSADNNVYAITTQGVLEWSRQLGGQVQLSSVAIGPNGNIYVGSTDNYFYSIGIVDTIPPAPPQNLEVVSGDKAVTLSWDENTESDFHHYIIYRSVISDFIPQSSDSLTSVPKTFTVHADMSVTNGLTYYYKLKAVDIAGNISQTSNQAIGTPTDLPPATPSNFMATSGDGYVTLSWSANTESDLARYILYHSQTSGFIPTADDSLVNVPAPDTTYIDSGLVNGQSYYYRLSAVDSLGNVSDTSNQVVGNPTDMTSPAVPQNLTVTNGDGCVTLSWSVNTESDLARYILYCSQTSGFIPTADDSLANVPAPDTTYIDSGLVNGQTYYYRLSAVDSVGNASDTSSQVVGHPVDMTPPAVPQNLIAFPGYQRVTINWNANNEADLHKYNIYRDLSSPAIALVDSVVASSPPDTFYIDSSLTNGITYYYRLTAVDTLFNESNFSDEVSATPADTVPPTAPQNLTAVVGNAQVTLIWNSFYLEDFLQYRIYGGTYSGPTTVVDSTSSLTDTEVTITGLINNTTYYYRVTAIDSALNESDFSNEVNVVPYGGPVWHVTTNGNNNNNGSESAPFATIQYSIDYSSNGDTVLVHPGTYVENINFNGKNIVVKSVSGSVSAIIDGNDNGTVVTFNNGENNTSELNGFTITNGNVSGISIGKNVSSSPLILNCIIKDNSGDWGGGIYCENSSAVFKNNLITNNEATYNGGGIYRDDDGSVDIINCTISGNSALSNGGGLSTASNDTVINCIIYDNAAPSSSNIHGSPNPAITYSNLQNGYSPEGEGNIDVEPLFVDADISDYYLSDYSPCIGAGTLTNAPSTDINGNPRPSPPGSNPDMGAYESSKPSQRPKSGIVNDGLSTDIDWWNSGNSISSNWVSFLDDSTITYEFALGNSPDSIANIFSWTTVGPDTVFTALGLTLSAGQTYHVNIRGTDIDNQVSDTTISDGFTVDLTNPVISYVYEGSATSDKDYQNKDTVLVLSWSGSDVGSGISYYEYALDTLSGDSGVVAWTPVGIDTVDTLLGISLHDGGTYYVSVRARDKAGNVSAIFTGDGITIDLTAPSLVVTVRDGLGEDIAYTGLDTVLSANWSGFSDGVSGIDEYAYAIGTLPNSNDIVPWTDVAADTSITRGGLTLSNGMTYYFSVQATDAAGYVSEVSSSDGVTVDTEVPIVGILLDGTGTDLDWTIDSTSLTASWGGFMDMLSGIGFYEYAIGTGSDSIAVVGWTPVDTATTVTKSDLHLSNNITYYFCIRATDQVGNISEVITSDGATVDLAVPIISYVYEGSLVSDKDYQNVADYLILSWSGSDVGSGISYYEYALDTLSGDSGVVTWTNVSTDTADTLAGVSLLEGATYYVSVRATDVAGNVSAKLTGDGIAIDLTAPVTGTVKDGTGEDIAYTGSDTSLSANWSGFSDGVSGIEEYEYTIGTTSGGTEVVDWASVLGDTSVTKGDLTLSNGETYYVSVRGTDRVGNTSTVVSSDGVIVDTGSPVAGVIIDGSVTDLDWINSVTTLSAAWSGFSDTLSGIEGYEYALGSSSGSSDVVDWTDVDTNRTVSRSDLTLSEGMTYYFSVRATDQVGNISQILTSDGITVDLTKPVLSYVCEGSLVSDKDYQNVADTLILSWLGSDVGSGISYYEYALDTLSGDSGFVAWTSVSTYTADTLAGVSLVEGATYYVSVRATDIAGNVSTKLTGDGITIDLTPPIVGNVNDGDADDIAFAGSDSSLSANWSGFSDAISGIEGYEFAIGTSTGGIDVTDWIWVGDTSSWSISSLSLNHGTQYFISVRASDIAGNVSDYSVSDGVIADVMVPSSEVVIESGFYNIAGWNIGNPIKGIASDANSGIAYVEISIRRTNDNHHWNGSSWVGSEQWLTAQGSENWNYSLSSSQLIDANNYEIISRAVDSVGNIETILSSDSFVFDITEPNTIFNIADEYYNPIGWESLAPIQGSANDDTSGIAQVEVRIQRNDVQQYWNGSEWSNDETWLSAQGTDEWQYTFLSAILSDGISYTINVRATDGAGNVETTYANDGFIFDLSPPFSTVLIDRDYYNNLNWIDASSISGTASDSISGLFTVEIAIQRSSNATWWDGTTWAAFQIWSTSIDLTNWTYSFGSTNWTNGVSYTVYSRATDVAGNIQVNWGEDTFNYDLTVPIIGQVFDGMPGEEIEWTNSTTTLSAYWTGFYDEVSGIDLYEYAIGTSSDGSDTGIWTEVGTDTMVTITNLNLQSGESYFISVKATDGAENTSPIATSDSVIVDAIPPVISSVIEGSLQEDQDYQQSSSDLILSWSGSDSWGISNYKISLGTTHGGTDIKDWIDVGIDSTHTFTGLTLEGGITYYGNVQAMDPAGNVSDIVTGDGIIVDQTGPIPGQVFDGDSTDVDWVSIDYFIKANWKGFSDVLSGIASYDYSVGLIPGETQIIDWYSVGLDSTLFTTAELIEGPTYYVNVRANDAVGNMGSLASSDGFGLDQTIPISGIVIDGLDVDLDWTANTTLLSASWSGFSDDKSGIAFYEYAIDTTSGGNELVDWTNNSDSTSFIKDDLSLVTGTTYYISVRAVDLVGNVSNGATSDGITVDNINPVVNIPNEGGIGEDYDFQNSLTELIISWTGSDAMRELMSYEYAIGTTPTGSDTVDWTDAGTQTNIIVTGLTLVEGITYYASVRALDMAGNVSGIATGDGITPDVTSPELGLVFDGFEAELTFTGTTDSLTARWTGFTDALSGISSYECAIGITAGDSDVVNWIPLGLDSSMVATDLSLTNGYRYYVSVRAIDSVGNRSGYVSSDGVIIDISPPILGLVIDGLSTDLDWTNNIDTLEASWSGFSDSLSGINFYEYALGTNSGESDVIYWQNNDTLRLVTGIGLNLMDGETYYFSVRATDNVRNVSAIVSSDGITVDTIPPVVSSVYEGSTELDLDYQSSDSTVILAWTGGDNASGIANYEYALGLSPGGIEILDWDSASTSLDTLIQSLVLDEGTTYFGSVRVYDVAGNLSTEVSGDGIMVDLTPPVPGSIIDGDSTDLVYTGSDSSLTATWVGFSDNLSGIQYYEYAIDTIPTGDDVYSWTDVGTDTTVTTSDLVLDDSVIYYQSIRAIDLVGNTSTIISSNGVTTDHSPPVTGIVFDGLDEDQTWTSSANTLSLSWTGFRDITCGIQFYEYAFDTTAGDDDLVPWTNVGLDTAVIKTGLTLENGITYYGSVRA
ncbi:MAG: PQQ-binding-like beta-propeller repeat protein, partial [Candidatus Marinimicrobia bacterium]|nr:PQQ-binding-like beta-propeller repeat protein [Candidatus Neomarinimicrobiota bacterium]